MTDLDAYAARIITVLDSITPTTNDDGNRAIALGACMPLLPAEVQEAVAQFLDRAPTNRTQPPTATHDDVRAIVREEIREYDRRREEIRAYNTVVTLSSDGKS